MSQIRHIWKAVMLLVLIGLLSACGDTTGSINTATTQPTSQPTQTATARPTAVSTHAPATHGTPQIGGPLSDFIGKYGPLNQFSDPGNEQYYFSLYGDNKDDLTLLIIDGKHVDTVSEDAPPNQTWSESTAIATCLAFAPASTIYKRQMTQTSGGSVQDIQRVYVSLSMAHTFPASSFIDENGNQTTPGTLGLILDYALNSTTRFMDCTLQVGLQAS